MMKKWIFPLLMWLMTSIGLIPALLGDGWYDIISNGLLAVPLIIFVWYFRHRSS